MASLQELSDRLEINDLLIRYTYAVDECDSELLDRVFTPDAEIDYTSSGGIAGRYPEIRAWLAEVLSPFPVKVHYVTNSTVDLDGDRARARTLVLNVNGVPNPDGTLNGFTVGAQYRDELVRTPDGWRIAVRVEEQLFLDSSTDVIPPATPGA